MRNPVRVDCNALLLQLAHAGMKLVGSAETSRNAALLVFIAPVVLIVNRITVATGTAAALSLVDRWQHDDREVMPDLLSLARQMIPPPWRIRCCFVCWARD